MESPETDREYEGALADADNKRVIAGRDQQLIGTKLIAPEEAETAEAAGTNTSKLGISRSTKRRGGVMGRKIISQCLRGSLFARVKTSCSRCVQRL